MARCCQHETDHLDGVLFLDRLDPPPARTAMRQIRAAPWYNADRAADGQGEPARRRDCSGSGPDMRLVFAGTPEVALPALDALRALRARAGGRA